MKELQELSDLINQINSCISESQSAPLSLETDSEYREKRSSREEFQIRLDEVFAEEKQIEEYFRTGKYDHIAKRQSLVATSSLKRGLQEVIGGLDSTLNEKQKVHQLQTEKYLISLKWLDSWNSIVKPFSLIEFAETQNNNFLFLVPTFVSDFRFYSKFFDFQMINIASPIGGVTLNSRVGDEIEYFAPTGRKQKDIVKSTKMPPLELLLEILEYTSTATGNTYHVDERYNPHFGGKYPIWTHGQDAARIKKGG
jgi:hypothetical protein